MYFIITFTCNTVFHHQYHHHQSELNFWGKKHLQYATSITYLKIWLFSTSALHYLEQYCVFPPHIDFIWAGCPGILTATNTTATAQLKKTRQQACHTKDKIWLAFSSSTMSWKIWKWCLNINVADYYEIGHAHVKQRLHWCNLLQWQQLSLSRH